MLKNRSEKNKRFYCKSRNVSHTKNKLEKASEVLAICIKVFSSGRRRFQQIGTAKFFDIFNENRLSTSVKIIAASFVRQSDGSFMSC
jgi:hypothetical protein